MQKSLWFVVSFASTFGALVVVSELFNGRGPIVEAVVQPSTEVLADIAIPTSGIVSAATGEVVPDFGPTLVDATVILLGGIGCSPNQIEALEQLQVLVDSGTTTSNTFAMYADPSLGLEHGKYESLVLRRVSQATFSFVVSTDPAFDLRALGIRAPQVVRVRDGRIVETIPPDFEGKWGRVDVTSG